MAVATRQSTQVLWDRSSYAVPVTGAPDNGVLPWIAGVCRQARIAAGRRQVHIAAAADVDQSTVNRFELAQGWPRDVDAMIAAYAEDLAIPAIELWRRAIDAWQSAQS